MAIASYAGNSKSAKLEDTIRSFMEYTDAANDWLIDNYYYVFFDFLSQDSLSAYATKCLDAGEYKAKEKDMLIMEVGIIFVTASDLLDDLLYQDAKEEFDDIESKYPDFSLLDQQLKGRKITTCTEGSVPQYSDGQELTFVKLDGKMSFFFGYGKPD